ncbi:hypothetical protein CEUSTIGMA_g7592.t1 [Chlamydomonas eustigma]|uniref:Uncharacterized protein n=1 Tax=Chlamydomonas eustigma TaxID=1157962 RepID=A0A250XAR1_9CHLO|nr:hypothetical protein CEUSTIGMA_g7592.t1 [Chlamydomonas eustigma]|eukprot:GAX80154.1 hypothetical protein CEUSTIGMA_g7592.t1 [Chlamydomonas eustigma]
MFWKVPGFSQPSPVERILDKEEYTLEELLDEDDIVQEAKSLNGRLIAFLREPTSVEQLVRYVVHPQDSDDPNKAYKYPFSSCELLCCELEAVYNTMLEEVAIMRLLFSLLDSPAPLNSKIAGYFGRVVGCLLSRKGNEMLQYFQAEGSDLLQKLVTHVDTTSVADVIKRMVGADDQSSIMPSLAMSQWLSETPLVDMLLSRLSSHHTAEAQANAADILTATANGQPSPLAFKLAEQPYMGSLMQHALSPGQKVLVQALDVCIAVLEPSRPMLGDASMPSASDSSQIEATQRAKHEAASAIAENLQALVAMLVDDQMSSNSLEFPYGVLSPPLGRHRLKVVELLAVLIRSNCPVVHQPFIACSALSKCMELFQSCPFNNMLHHCVASMLMACMSSSSEAILSHLFEECRILNWIVELPQTVASTSSPARKVHGPKVPLRAGYLGHVTQIANALEGLSNRTQQALAQDNSHASEVISGYTKSHERWLQYVETVLHPQLDLENTSKWACGRPAAGGISGLDGDGDDFQVGGISGLEGDGDDYQVGGISGLEGDGDDFQVGGILGLEGDRDDFQVGAILGLEGDGNDFQVGGILGLKGDGDDFQVGGISGLEGDGVDFQVGGILGLEGDGDDFQVGGILGLEGDGDDFQVGGISGLEGDGDDFQVGGISNLEGDGDDFQVGGILGLEGDGDDFQHELDLEQITGLQQPLYHRYSTEENEDDEEEEEEEEDENTATYKATGYDFSSDMVTEGLSGLDINGMYMTPDHQHEEQYGQDEGGSIRSQPTVGSRGDAGGMIPDDDVLLANSDEEFPSEASPERVVPVYIPGKVYNLDGSLDEGQGPEDMVLVEEESGDTPSTSWTAFDQKHLNIPQSHPKLLVGVGSEAAPLNNPLTTTTQ